MCGEMEEPMASDLNELESRLAEVIDLRAAASVLQWDQLTYMPPGGGIARARQLATLRQLAHSKFTDPVLGDLLDRLRIYEQSLDYDSDDASLIRVARRDYEKAVQVPPSFMAELSSHSAASYEAWVRARPANDFESVQAYLEKTLDLSRRYSSFFPDCEHVADPLIDNADQGMTASTISALFANLREQLVPIVQAIVTQPTADDECLLQEFPEQEQIGFGVQIIKRFGYDLERGRLDKTAHPFTIEFSRGDVRITTRVNENDLSEALFSTLHEAGHALYEQGVSEDLDSTLIGGGTSSGVHESQSRLWENLVGRSRGFWEHFYPRLQEVFPSQVGNVPLDTFYRAVNKVAPSLIRTDADEVTYNLHVMMRFDLELALLEGKLAIPDLPDAWRDRLEADLGVKPPDDRDGVLQDVHWYSGLIGGSFQGYTLGNILSAQFFEAARNAHPEIDSELEQGEFSSLHRWLKKNIYHHGRKYSPSELVERVTGGPITIEPYIRYLRTKYGELYDL
jgi:carboxypeptidase Taq